MKIFLIFEELFHYSDVYTRTDSFLSALLSMSRFGIMCSSPVKAFPLGCHHWDTKFFTKPTMLLAVSHDFEKKV